MASIQYLRSKGVRDAWTQEVALVKQGKGSRLWTLQEQYELLTTGRIRGYYGHHIRSVSQHPELASDFTNIQFLTYKEHHKVHLKKWKLSLQNYYDVATKSISLTNVLPKGQRRIYELKEKYQDLSKEEKEKVAAMNDLSYQKCEERMKKETMECKNSMDAFFLRKHKELLSKDVQKLNELAIQTYKKFGLEPKECEGLIKEYYHGKENEKNSLANTFSYMFASIKVSKQLKSQGILYTRDGRTQCESKDVKKFAGEMKKKVEDIQKDLLHNENGSKNGEVHQRALEEVKKAWSIEDSQGTAPTQSKSQQQTQSQGRRS